MGKSGKKQTEKSKTLVTCMIDELAAANDGMNCLESPCIPTQAAIIQNEVIKYCTKHEENIL